MSDLSPFHQEMLSFLKSTASAREKQEGFDSDSDPDLKQLYNSIDSTLGESSKPLALDEILEDYRDLFEKRGPIYLERQWFSSFSKQEFEQLGLGVYFPNIYRGLPRLYHRDNPSRSVIKKNFTNLTELRRLSVDRAVFSLYDGVSLPPGMKVVLFGWVIPGGLGDWVALQSSADAIREKLPQIDLQLIYLTPRKLPPCEVYPSVELLYEKEPSIADFTPEALMLLRESDLILQIPTFFPQSNELWETVLRIPSERRVPIIESIGEYGFLESGWFHPQSKNRSMGLHALEKGIFTHKVPHCTFAEIDQKNLLTWMFGTETPGPHEIEAYEKKSRFFLGYLVTPFGGSIYLHSLLKMHERDEKDIDLCSPDLGWLTHWIEARKEKSLPILEELFGVKEILIFAFNQTHRLSLAPNGKTLRILCPGAISLSDMRKLFYLSGEWVAVRGDQSFTDAVSAKKAFFYDGLEHARYFIKDLTAFAENRLAGHRSALEAFRMMGQAFLWNLPEETGEWVDETHFQQGEKMAWTAIATELGNCLNDPDVIVGFKKFCLMMKEERSFNEFLCHFVQKNLFHTLHPDIRDIETRQLNLYLAGKLTFSSFVKNHRIRMMQTKGDELGFYRSQ